jgi:hypothetical protein
MSLLELREKIIGKINEQNFKKNAISRHDPRKIGGAWAGDEWIRECPICHKLHTIIVLANNGNRTPCCGVYILG